LVRFRAALATLVIGYYDSRFVDRLGQVGLSDILPLSGHSQDITKGMSGSGNM
jgi:hypothetical protein